MDILLKKEISLFSSLGLILQDTFRCGMVEHGCRILSRIRTRYLLTVIRHLRMLYIVRTLLDFGEVWLKI